jgi:phosphoribosylamine---glycine ligase
MKVLIVGGGGREHALAWKMRRDDPALKLVAAPGNAGIADLARCIPVRSDDIPSLLGLAEDERPDLTVVGPEVPLALGIVDRFQNAKLPIFGPTRAAAELESSKSFAKTVMQRAGVSTASAEPHTHPDEARTAARRFGTPVVIKASGLAAGKGVIVCHTLSEADDAIDEMLGAKRFGAAGAEILVEEFMDGEELSVLALTDGRRVLPMLPAQDHKRLLEGDRGPNTGGMGAYVPVSIAGGSLQQEIVDEIFLPTLEVMRELGRPFNGVVYAGLMVTTEGPRVVEFNARFGDPETEAILPLLRSNLLELMLAIAHGESLPESSLEWERGASVSTVVAAHGYPDAPRTGDVIRLDPPPADVHVFHAGTARSSSGDLVTAGGRVFAVTGLDETVEEAQRASTQGAAGIHFAGRHFRSDIGWRELQRNAGASRD